jgi:hypothetical protein
MKARSDEMKKKSGTLGTRNREFLVPSLLYMLNLKEIIIPFKHIYFY